MQPPAAEAPPADPRAVDTSSEPSRLAAEMVAGRANPAQAPGAETTPVRPVADRLVQWVRSTAPSGRDLGEVAARLAERGSEVYLHLHPPELGGVRVRLVSEPGQTLWIQMAADRPETGQALSRHAGQLQQALQDAGLQLGGLSVEVGNGSWQPPGLWQPPPAGAWVTAAPVMPGPWDAAVAGEGLPSPWGGGLRGALVQAGLATVELRV